MNEAINVIQRLENVMTVFFEEAQKNGAGPIGNVLAVLATKFNGIENPNIIDQMTMFGEIVKLFEKSIDFMSHHEYSEDGINYLREIRNFLLNSGIMLDIGHFNNQFPIIGLRKVKDFSYAYRYDKDEPNNLDIYAKLTVFCEKTKKEIEESDLANELKEYLIKLLLHLENSAYSYKYKGKEGIDAAINSFFIEVTRIIAKEEKPTPFLINLASKTFALIQIAIIAGDAATIGNTIGSGIATVFNSLKNGGH
jgi:hypothetical protein